MGTLKYYLYRILIATALFLIIDAGLFAQETVVVQTFTKDSIFSRQGIFHFPDNNDTYRKILMYYNLRCDPRTPWDLFSCGEWDYDKYTFIHKHTGIWDSTLLTAPKYNFGSGSPDTLYFLSAPTYNTYQKSYPKIVIGSVITESDTILGEGTGEIVLHNRPTRLQFLFSKDYLKSTSLQGKTFTGMKLFVKTPGAALKNFTLKITNSTQKNLEKLDDVGTAVLYRGDITFTNAGWNTIYFLDPYKSGSLFGFNIQISYESIENVDSVIIASDELYDCVISENQDSYLEFDGRYDYVRCDRVVDELKGAKKFTVEFRAKLDAWRNGGSFMTIGDALQFRTVQERPWTTWPNMYQWVMRDGGIYGIMVGGTVDYSGKWAHFAFVYDADLGQYDGRIKFYINGTEQKTYIRGVFPDAFTRADKFLTLTSSGANLDCDIDEFRIWTGALDKSVLQEWSSKNLGPEHPNYDGLAVYYSMNKTENFKLIDESGKSYNATLIGTPAVRILPAESQTTGSAISPQKPQISMVSGEYESHIDEVTVAYKEANPPLSLVTYELNGRNHDIANVSYVWEPGYEYTFSPSGTKIDSVYKNWSDKKVNEKFQYYSAPVERTDPWEIGRFITPYGINLDLGPNGFTWVYDVTDYAGLLKGDVDLSTHSTQELIDLKFVFFKGTPPRNVKNINRVWGPVGGFSYSDLERDIKCPPLTVPLTPGAEQYKIKCRLTGHGAAGVTGNGCCEFKDNTHYFFVDNDLADEWKIFRYYECASNPVFPQGGTWLYQREGWCPGDVVYDHEIEITDRISGDSVNLDYGVDPIPGNDPGMGGGHYQVNIELVEYGEANFKNDVEIYDVIAPNDFDYYSRRNPVCSGPKVIIRNNGFAPVNSVNFIYGVSGGKEETYTWSAPAESQFQPNKKVEVQLPISGNAFWLGDSKNAFTVKINSVDSKSDDYALNDSYKTTFKRPDLYSGKLVLKLKTNLRGSDFSLSVKSLDGKTIIDRKKLGNNALYIDTLNLTDGCYTLDLSDNGYQFGLSYWAFPDQGEGYMRLCDAAGKVLKEFNPDCGIGYNYSFSIGDAQDVQEPGLYFGSLVYPNPAGDILNIELKDIFGPAEFQIMDISGKRMSSVKSNINENDLYRLDINSLAPGAYFVRIINGDKVLNKIFIKN